MRSGTYEARFMATASRRGRERNAETNCDRVRVSLRGAWRRGRLRSIHDTASPLLELSPHDGPHTTSAASLPCAVCPVPRARWPHACACALRNSVRHIKHGISTIQHVAGGSIAFLSARDAHQTPGQKLPRWLLQTPTAPCLTPTAASC